MTRQDRSSPDKLSSSPGASDALLIPHHLSYCSSLHSIAISHLYSLAEAKHQGEWWCGVSSHSYFFLMSEYKFSGDIKQMYKQCHSFYTDVCSFGTLLLEQLTFVVIENKEFCLHLKMVYIFSLNSKATSELFQWKQFLVNHIAFVFTLRATIIMCFTNRICFNHPDKSPQSNKCNSCK